MASIWLAYRMTVFAPRSQDATEATILTPTLGAAHSDNFDVATISGIGGVQPYLQKPDGQNGAIDPVSKNTSVGTRVMTVGDKSLGSNAVRWVTAFLGDASGRNRLKGCKAIVYEQTSVGGAWNPWFTGRVGNVSLDGKLKFKFEIKSSIDDMNRKRIFLYDPDPGITYAFRSAIFPPRLTRSWGSGTLPAGAWLSATISGKYTDANGLTHGFLDLVQSGEDLHSAAMVTRQGAPFSAGLAPGSVFLKVTAGGATGLFSVPKHTKAYANTYNKNGTPRRYLQRQIGELVELPSAHPLHMALPANGTAVTFYVQGDQRTPVSQSAPLFIDDVHPIQLWADILDGKYGIIDTTAFTARAVAPRDASGGGPWDYANNSFADLPKVRFIINGPAKAKDWIEQNICQPFNLSYYPDGQGRIVPVDLRPTSATAVSGSITDTDCVTLPTDWTVDGTKALLGVAVTYYADFSKHVSPADLYATSPDAFPDMEAMGVDSSPQPWIVLNPLLDVTRDAGDQTTSVDAQGIRLTEQEVTGGAGVLAQLDKLSKLTIAMQDLLAPFAGGAVTVPLELTRASAFAASGAPGQFWTLTVSTLPDPATNQRGGPRVGLCLSRTDTGLRILATFLDVGSATAAATPTIGTLAITNGGLDVPITVNANHDPVQVEYIVTPAGTGSRPAQTDPGWRLSDAPIFPTANATWRQAGVPANTRLWVRARSRPMGNGLKLPSAYVFPAAGSPAGSIDVAAITAPSSLATANLVGNATDLTWTNGDATMAIEVYLTTGGVPGTWTQAMKQFTLPAGTTSTRLGRLIGSTGYAAAVRHVDAFGGSSAFATVTFTTTGTPRVAPVPPYVWVLPVPNTRPTVDPSKYL